MAKRVSRTRIWNCKLALSDQSSRSLSLHVSFSHLLSIFFIFIFSPHYFKNIKISALALLKMVGNCLFLNKQLKIIDEVVVISRIIKVEVGVISRIRRLISLTENEKNKNGSHVLAPSLTANNTKRANLT